LPGVGRFAGALASFRLTRSEPIVSQHRTVLAFNELEDPIDSRLARLIFGACQSLLP
jgi:hypothetical protein